MLWKWLKYQEYDFSGKYKISEYGDIMNVQTGHLLTQKTNRGGYRYVCISLEKHLGLGPRKLIVIHKAVAYTYLRNEKGNPMVDHLDCNKSNNHYSNLEWVTASENTKRAYHNGLLTNHAKRKLTDENVTSIKEMLASKLYTHEQIAQRFGVTRSAISQISRNEVYSRI